MWAHSIPPISIIAWICFLNVVADRRRPIDSKKKGKKERKRKKKKKKKEKGKRKNQLALVNCQIFA